MTHYDIAVVGGGPGGYTAALYCARAGFSVLVLERLAPGGQMAATGQIDNYPGFPQGVDGFELGQRMQEGARRFGAETVMAQVTALRLAERPKQIETTAGSFTARCVILATGAYPRTLGLPEEEALRGRGVSYCATCDGMFYRGKTVAVVGGGNTAVGEALHLSRLCEKVYLIHRRDTLAASPLYLPRLKEANVEILWNSRVTGLPRQDNVLSGLELEDVRSGQKRTLPCQGLFVAIGRVPDTQLYQGQLELDEKGYIPATEDTKTELPGVFAVGDVRKKPLRQIVTATADGAVAAWAVEEYLTHGGR